MSLNFPSVERALHANYSWATRGMRRVRSRRLLFIATADVVAVTVALGAVHLIGSVVAGGHFGTFLSAVDRTTEGISARSPIAATTAVPITAVSNVTGEALVPASEATDQMVVRHANDDVVALLAGPGTASTVVAPADGHVLFAKPESAASGFSPTSRTASNFEAGWQEPPPDKGMNGPSAQAPRQGEPSENQPGAYSGSEGNDRPAFASDIAPPLPRPRPAWNAKSQHESRVAMAEDMESGKRPRLFGLLGINIATGPTSSAPGTSAISGNASGAVAGATGAVSAAVSGAVGAVGGAVGAVGGAVGGVAGGLGGGR